mmetsp:Transcript_47409/g.148328  ORF Transcript_47409/g.148328 Transcript_47409/m.148328 type:complete len:189 (-) Transcript_47409:2186-2752(-)
MMPPVESLVKYEEAEKVTGKTKSKKSNAAADPKAKSVQTEDILNAILPPREWTEGGELWVQYVSTQMPTRSDAIRLAERLDQRLKLRGAREHGICTIREEIYAQCFDELIRQVTIDCPERGLLFLRLRDEARMRIAAYQSLYESSLAFAVRKAVTGEEQRNELLHQTKNLTNECEELRHALHDQTVRM